jgi:phosphatidylinositol dimannoside acyltransferase
MKVQESILRDTLRLLIWFPFRRLIGVVPLAWAFSLYKKAGALLFVFDRGKKRLLARNLSAALSLDAETAAGEAKRIFENHSLDRLHIFLYPRIRTWERIAPFVEFENRWILDNELKRGRGALLIQPHFGPVQITLLCLALKGYHPLQIGYPSDEGLSAIGRKVAFRYRLKYEAMLPAAIVPADGYLGAVFKHLVRGGVVLTTGDGAGGGVLLGEHREFPFLGSKKMIPLGPSMWALRTRAALIPTFIIVERHDRFRIVFESPIEPLLGDPALDKVDMTRRFLFVAERYIRQFPSCWHFWDEMA